MTTAELKELFLRDEKVNVWYKDLEEGSKSTAENYLLWLVKYCKDRELKPLELAKEAKRDLGKAQDKLQKYIQSLRDRPPKTRGLALYAVKSWLVSNDIVIQRRIKIKNVRSTPTIVNERLPTSQELETILDHADIRGKSAISLIAFAGIRPEATSNLMVGDLVDFKINSETRKVEVFKTPARVNVRSEISKNKRSYFTFLSSQGCKYLKEYLEMRMRPHKDLMTGVVLEGDVLTKNEAVIKASTGRPRDNGFLTRKALSKTIRTAFRKANFNERPYVLRSYFDTAMLVKGFPHAYQQFIMGHSGDIESVYTVNKRLDDKQVEEMRSLYRELVEPRLATKSFETEVNKDEIEKLIELKSLESSPNTYRVVGEENRTALELIEEKEKELKRKLTIDEKIQLLKQRVKLRDDYHNQLFEEDKLRSSIIQLKDSITSRHSNSSLSEIETPKQMILSENELKKSVSEGMIAESVLQLPSGELLVRFCA